MKWILPFLLCASVQAQIVISGGTISGGVVGMTNSSGGGGGGGDINTALVNHFKFDENTGTTTTDSVGGVIGTFHGSGVTTWGTPKIGVSSVNFNGGGAGVTLGTTITTGTTCTYAFWVFPTSATVGLYQAVFSQDGNHAIFLKGNGTGLNVNFYVNTLGGDHLSATALSINTWHHVVVVNNSGTISFYVDSIIDPNTYPSIPSLSLAGLGSDSGVGSEPMSGRLDDTLIYSRALSQADVTALFNSTTGPTP